MFGGISIVLNRKFMNGFVARMFIIFMAEKDRK